MTKGRLEAFSDGVIAIIITIMVLEIKVPHVSTFEGLLPLAPVFLSYVLSFAYVGIYWNNHHNMLHCAERVSGGVLWANLHLLFWMSLIPFTTGWMGENHFGTVPTALYGVVLLCSAGAYLILQRTLLRAQGPGSRLERALGRDLKGKVSAAMYAVAIGAAFVSPPVSWCVYVAVALTWFIPDTRMEREMGSASVQGP